MSAEARRGWFATALDRDVGGRREEPEVSGVLLRLPGSWLAIFEELNKKTRAGCFALRVCSDDGRAARALEGWDRSRRSGRRL